jgi:CheY-like chemotaxis protein
MKARGAHVCESVKSARPIVLIVEDDPDVADAIADVLRGEGHKIYAAEHGRRAIELLNEGIRPDVILLDLMMPVMNGWQFREAQLDNPDWSIFPVVVISAEPLDAQAMSLFTGARFLPKPISFEALVSVLHEVHVQTLDAKVRPLQNSAP